MESRDSLIPPPFWPVEAMKNADLYFYQEVIEAFLPGCRVRVAGYGEMLMLGGHSYLDLEGHPALRTAALEAMDRYGTGIHGSRLLAGTLAIHGQLEAKIAAFKKAEAAMTFTSGFAANISVISALLGRRDLVFADRLAHASLLDGCQLSRAKIVRFRHNDADDLDALLAASDKDRQRLVVVDGVYSMDGDIAELPAISQVCRRHGALLLVDEAHSFGVLGATGRGIEEHFGLAPDWVDIKMGTLSKAIPASGAYIAGSRRLIELLGHQAHGFVYSGALAPIPAAVALAALGVLEQDPERIERLHQNAAFFAQLLRQAGFEFRDSPTPIFPILCGEDELALRLARGCQKRGIFIQAVIAPVVPPGSARLRAVITAGHSREDLEWSVGVLTEVAKEIGGILPDRRTG